MRRFGLIGYPLEHSFSPAYFSEKFYREGINNASYELFPLSRIDEFPALLDAETGLSGLNVTIPYKEAVIPYLAALSPSAEAMGAVNTIAFSPEGLVGHNTDWLGFRDAVTPLLPQTPGKALVLGTGGSAKAVHYALQQAGWETAAVSRREQSGVAYTYQNLDAAVVEDHHLVVNCTPLGMHPNELTFPDLPYDAMGPNHVLFDLVYNPLKTVFLIKGEQRGATIKNGLAMLHGQAEAAWDIWNEEEA